MRGAWSLRHKLLGVVLVVMACMGSGLVGALVIGAERERNREAARGAAALSAAIDRTLRSAMLSGDREVVRGAVNILAEQAEVSSVAVLDETGRRLIHAGTGAGLPDEIKRLIDRARSSDAVLRARVGDTAYAIVSPVRSQPACARCHGQKARLGFISAVVSTAGQERRIRAMRNWLLWGGLMLLAATCAAIYLAVSHWVERPVSTLTHMVDQVRGGDSRASGSANTGDEIARLKGSFESMLAEIGEKTEAVLKAERDLAQSQRLASIGLLAAGIAHEIGGPLCAIELQAGFWRERSEGPVRAASETITQAAKQIGELQRELLTFDRREALSLTQCDLRDLVRKCLGVLGSTNVRCQLDAPGTPLAVSADQTLLTRALGNVLNNAAEAMEGRGTLAVAIRRVAGNRAEIALRDTGPGIAHEDLPHIFEPFFTRKEGSGGAGLGLAIAREIIVRHQGTMTAETTAQGTCFRIWLPLESPEETDGADPDR